ncbi:MAG: aminodeoxychorismate/anthranilate synthase component II, partial [Candidatus Delongbacteria bacterium]|nr:aminodeoxychorismate/anthranilate synthase component II [Candidatus Delongbacteria bacterium]
MVPSHIVISPGPGRPEQAGISQELIRRFAGRIPILGVCLGHQAIGQVFGGRVVAAPYLMHGKTSMIHHDGRGIFLNIPSPFKACRYHSLMVDEDSLIPVASDLSKARCFPKESPLTPFIGSSDDLEIVARSDDRLIMALAHRRYPLYGVQFHPESILTDFGRELIKNFLLTRCDSSSVNPLST